MDKTATNHVVGAAHAAKDDAGALARDAAAAVEAAEKMGLVARRAYAVVACGEAMGFKLLKLRLPLAPAAEERARAAAGKPPEWIGRFSDESDDWRPQLRQMLSYSRNSADNTFWILYEDFCTHFNKARRARAACDPPAAPHAAHRPCDPRLCAGLLLPDGRRRVDQVRRAVAVDGRLRRRVAIVPLVAIQLPMAYAGREPADRARVHGDAGGRAQDGRPRPRICHRDRADRCARKRRRGQPAAQARPARHGCRRDRRPQVCAAGSTHPAPRAERAAVRRRAVRARAGHRRRLQAHRPGGRRQRRRRARFWLRGGCGRGRLAVYRAAGRMGGGLNGSGRSTVRRGMARQPAVPAQGRRKGARLRVCRAGRRRCRRPRHGVDAGGAAVPGNRPCRGGGFAGGRKVGRAAAGVARGRAAQGRRRLCRVRAARRDGRRRVAARRHRAVPPARQHLAQVPAERIHGRATHARAARGAAAARQRARVRVLPRARRHLRRARQGRRARAQDRAAARARGAVCRAQARARACARADARVAGAGAWEGW